MSLQEDHLHQAEANRRFAHHLVREQSDNPTALQWAVTVAFYAALHCVQSHYVLKLGSDAPTNHFARDQAMRDYPLPDHVHTAYRILRTQSESARYRLREFDHVTVDTLLGKYLERVTQWARLAAWEA